MRAIPVLRVDPYRRTVARVMLKPAKDPTPQIRHYIRVGNVGSRQIMEVEGKPLMVIAGLDVDEEMQGWRLRGTDDTAGIAIVTGRQVNAGGLIETPVTVAWMLARIQWLDGEDVAGRDAHAEEVLPSLNDDVRQAIAEAVPLPAGGMCLLVTGKDLVGDAMVTLGLGTERSGGQMLTKLGEAVHDKIIAAVRG